MTRITPTNEAWKDCPRAEECGVNDCPLTLKRYKSDSSDFDKRCTFGKTGRMRIGKKWNLANRGLKPRELSSAKQWENLSPEEQELKRKKLSDLSPINRLSEKGYTMCPKKKINRQIHEQNAQMPPEQGIEVGFEDRDEVVGK